MSSTEATRLCLLVWKQLEKREVRGSERLVKRASAFFGVEWIRLLDRFVLTSN